jgi:hypothetical protein
MPKSPVFIVGSPRSGTSILVNALSGVGYSGYQEGNFLPLMQLIDKVIDQHFAASIKTNRNILVAQVDSNILKCRIEDIFKELTDSLNTTPPWFDKSGNHVMIWAIPTLRRLWPASVFIFAKRRAIENIVSRTKKFPGRNFEYHCEDWARNMSAWRAIREDLPAETYLEVEQQDMVRDTKAISAKISGLLGLDMKESEILAEIFKSRRPQETRKGSATNVYSLDSAGWSASEIEIFKKHCEPEMVAYGYGIGTEYYR